MFEKFSWEVTTEDPKQSNVYEEIVRKGWEALRKEKKS